MGQEVNSKAYDMMLSGMLSHSVEEIDVKTAKLMQDVVFIDSREKKEYDVSHIQGALWLGYDHADLSMVDGISRDTNIIVYCSVGYRSEKIAEKLKERGFKNVKNLYGGIFEWVNQEKEIVDPSGKSTVRVHAYNRMWGIWLNKGQKVYD
jgi:rhodanese-related sulfurtransferase